MGKGKDRSAFKQQNSSRPEKLGLLDEQTTGYYRRIADVLKGDFETAVEKGTLSPQLSLTHMRIVLVLILIT